MIDETKTGSNSAETANVNTDGDDVKVEVVEEGTIPEAQPYPGPEPHAQPADSGNEKQDHKPGVVPGNTKRVLARGANLISRYGGIPLIIAIASLVIIIASSVNKANPPIPGFDEFESFAVAYGVISFVASVAFLVITRKEMFPERIEQIRRVTIVFLFVWNAVGAGLVTFKWPFPFVSNGYFAAWIAFFGSYLLIKAELSQVEELENKFRGFGEHCFPLTMTSFIFLFSTITVCGSSNTCTGTLGYAVAVAVVGIVGCLVFAFANDQLPQKARLGLSGFLALWWLIAVFVTTFSTVGAFTVFGNAYFSVWGSFIISVLLFDAEMQNYRNGLGQE